MGNVRRKRSLTTTQIIAGGFLISIILGMVLLMLPVSSRSGSFTDPVDALFTSTTSVCVTGLTTVTISEHFSIFGQLVIMLLIQVGGLGVVTFTTALLLISARKITLRERMLIKDAYNLNSMTGLITLTKKIIKGTFICELIGAFFYSIVYVRDFGAIGIYYGIFNAVSSFCNAGMDLLGSKSLMAYQDNVIINLVTMVLIILGGLGFPVWWELIKSIKERKRPRGFFGGFSVHTKLVLTMTAALVLGGMFLILFIEYNNPDTLGNMTFPQKLMASAFQSVTTRTAGFYTIPQENFKDASAFVCLILMFIGGSPSGTAGGVKTVTIAMIVLTVAAIIKNKDDTEVFGRRISGENVRKGIAVVVISLVILTLSMGFLSVTQGSDFLDTLYETVSAFATVGLSRNFTSSLDVIGKLIVIVTMYIGRIGPISLALFFNLNRQNTNARRLPKEDIYVG